MVNQIMQIFNYLIMQGYKSCITKLENFGKRHKIETFKPINPIKLIIL